MTVIKRRLYLYGFRNTAPVPSRQPFHSSIGRDGFCRTVSYAITAVENRAAYGVETVFTVHVQMVGNRIEINRTGTELTGYNNCDDAANSQE